MPCWREDVVAGQHALVAQQAGELGDDGGDCILLDPQHRSNPSARVPCSSGPMNLAAVCVLAVVGASSCAAPGAA